MCGLIETVLDADSDELSLVSSREREPFGGKMRQWSTLSISRDKWWQTYCLALVIWLSSFFADISYYVLFEGNVCLVFPCQDECSVCFKDSRRAGCSDTNFTVLPIKLCLWNAWFQESTVSKFELSWHHLVCSAHILWWSQFYDDLRRPSTLNVMVIMSSLCCTFWWAESPKFCTISSFWWECGLIPTSWLYKCRYNEC